MPRSTQHTGSVGEQAAADYLSANGFTLLHRNWRHGRYELDIVAQKGDTLHIVEVKCRRRAALTPPEMAATAAKFSALQKAAAAYVAAYAIDLDVQFDLAAVEYDEAGTYVRYIPAAMSPRW